YLLVGYAVLMALVQLRLIPRYASLRFSLGFWAFTFPYAATATDALLWITLTHPAGAAGYAIAVVTLITGFIAAIAVRTLIPVAPGELLLRGSEQPLGAAQAMIVVLFRHICVCRVSGTGRRALRDGLTGRPRPPGPRCSRAAPRCSRAASRRSRAAPALLPRC